MLPAAVIAAATLSMAVAATAFACHGWEKIFESKQKGVHFAGIQAGDDADWVAGGIGIAAAGTGAAHDEQPLPGVAMESFGAGPDGTLYAAGSHGTIWRRVVNLPPLA